MRIGSQNQKGVKELVAVGEKKSFNQVSRLMSHCFPTSVHDVLHLSKCQQSPDGLASFRMEDWIVGPNRAKMKNK